MFARPSPQCNYSRSKQISIFTPLPRSLAHMIIFIEFFYHNSLIFSLLDGHLSHYDGSLLIIELSADMVIYSTSSLTFHFQLIE